jgi:hypothetical protein
MTDRPTRHWSAGKNEPHGYVRCSAGGLHPADMPCPNQEEPKGSPVAECWTCKGLDGQKPRPLWNDPTDYHFSLGIHRHAGHDVRETAIAVVTDYFKAWCVCCGKFTTCMEKVHEGKAKNLCFDCIEEKRNAGELAE